MIAQYCRNFPRVNRISMYVPKCHYYIGAMPLWTCGYVGNANLSDLTKSNEANFNDQPPLITSISQEN